MKCERLFISDIHLGDPLCRYEELQRLLDRVDPKEVVLLGDIVDVKYLSTHGGISRTDARRIVLVLRRLLHRPATWVVGNHDRILTLFRRRANRRLVFTRSYALRVTATKFIWVTHGDKIAGHERSQKMDFFYGVVARLYRTLLALEYRLIAWGFHVNPDRLVVSQIKLSSALLQRRYTEIIRRACITAEEAGAAGIIMGHTHQPCIKELRGVTYMNCGDWVENCTAIVQLSPAEFRLVDRHLITIARTRFIDETDAPDLLAEKETDTGGSNLAVIEARSGFAAW